VTSHFRRGVNEIFALLGCYAAWIVVSDVSGQPVGPSSRVKQYKSNIHLRLLDCWTEQRSHTHGAPQTDVTLHARASHLAQSPTLTSHELPQHWSRYAIRDATFETAVSGAGEDVALCCRFSTLRSNLVPSSSG